MKQNHIVSVGIAFVALTAAGTLNVVWRIGTRVQDELRVFGDAWSVRTPLYLYSQVALTVVAVLLVVAAILVRRHSRAVTFLVLLGLLQLSVAGAWVAVLWLPFARSARWGVSSHGEGGRSPLAHCSVVFLPRKRS